MVDFANIKALEINDATEAEYTFDMIEGEPSIFFAPAHDSNKAFQTERLRISIERSEKVAKRPRGKALKITPEELARQDEEDREADRVLLARCCARRWGTPPVDKDGNVVDEFSEQNVYDFLRALPIYMLDPLRNWAGNIYNFVQRPETTKGEGERLGNA